MHHDHGKPFLLKLRMSEGTLSKKYPVSRDTPFYQTSDFAAPPLPSPVLAGPTPAWPLDQRTRYLFFAHCTPAMDEATRGRLAARGLRTDCPAISAPNGDIVYQNKYFPWTLPSVEKTPVFSRRNGLGIGFEKWSQHELVEFLDDYLECADILALASTSKEWNFFASSEKCVISRQPIL